jgi:LysR family transcriptional regulator, transcriptional activator of the cysJI operon
MLEALLAREIQLALIEGPEQRKDLHIDRLWRITWYWSSPQLMDGPITIVKVDDLKSEPLERTFTNARIWLRLKKSG